MDSIYGIRYLCSMGYADITFNDPFMVKRYFQEKRLQHALQMVSDLPAGSVVLDYGAGNGELCKLIAQKRPDLAVICYEPHEQLRQEAVDNLKPYKGVKIVSRTQDISQSADLIFCLEVFEHLPEMEFQAAVMNFTQLLKKTGRLVVGVPNEIHLPALLKGLFRKFRRNGGYDTCLKRIWKATLGEPPSDRPAKEFVKGQSYYFHHLGFDYRMIPEKFKNDFTVKNRFSSPFIFLPSWANSECYFIFRFKD